MGNLRDRLVQANQMAEMLRNRLEVIDSKRRVDADCQTDEIAIAVPTPVTPVAKRKIRAVQSTWRWLAVHHTHTTVWALERATNYIRTEVLPPCPCATFLGSVCV
jgi:hypothetical protein